MKESKDKIVASFRLTMGEDGWSFYLTRTDVDNTKIVDIVCKKSKGYDKIGSLAEEFGVEKGEKKNYGLSMAIQTKAFLAFMRLGDKHYKVYAINDGSENQERDFVFTEKKEVVKNELGRGVYKITL